MAYQTYSPKHLDDLEGWDLKWALARCAGEKEIRRMVPGHFGIVTPVTYVVKGENGKPDEIVNTDRIRPYSERDHADLLASFNLNCVDDDKGYTYSVKNVGDFRSIHQSDAKARAIIAMKTGKLEVDFPD
ncbi:MULTISPECIES: hypothetical protein [Pseudomonas]|uniref:hypothetical protein n=1 Tax=Pseudomonas TaxID=286 RepID=UPI0028EDB116|nr:MULTISPECIES: hypothetical protein [Pseudomonas]